MVDLFYSYKVRREIPLLSEEDYKSVVVHLSNRIDDIMRYRKKHKCSLEEASINSNGGQKALAEFEKITGVRLKHPDEIYIARKALYGRLCDSCHKPFRTPRAKFCAECGMTLSHGEIAGPL
jgi:hypothetical protein